MQPTLPETLESIRRTLLEDLLPEVSSPFAHRTGQQLASAIAKLEQWWEKVIPLLMEENDDLTRLFESGLLAVQAAGARQQDAELEDLERALRQAVDSGRQHANKYPCYPELEERNLLFRTVLVKAINVLEAVSQTHGEDSGLLEFRRGIRSHLRKYIDLELEVRGIDPKQPPGA